MTREGFLAERLWSEARISSGRTRPEENMNEQLKFIYKTKITKADFDLTDLKFSGDVIKDEVVLRNAIAQALAKKKSVFVFSFLNASQSSFPIIGMTKIASQEVLRAIKKNKNLKAEFYFNEKKTLDVFKKATLSYIGHVLNDLDAEPYVTVDIIIELAEGIVLIERSNPPYGWALPGGFLDAGESLEEAAVREAKEETNLDLKDLRQMHTYSDPKRDPRFHTISTVFIATGVGQAKAGDDAKGLKVVPYGDLMKLRYAFDHNRVIEDYLRQKR